MMTRPSRKPDEVWAISVLIDALRAESTEWHEDLEAVTDCPDLVLSGPGGVRVACEITQVGLSEWHRWHNDRGLKLDLNQLDESSVPREVDLWLSRAIEDKAPSVRRYVANASAAEAWLLVHGGINKAFDFFVLDDGYDIPLLVQAAQDSEHPFNRIYVASSSSSRVVCAYPWRGSLCNPPDITDPSILKVLSIRSQEVQTQRGVTTLTLGDEFQPHRERILPLLEPDRMKTQ